MDSMGMADKQFNGFVRFLLDALKDADNEQDAEKKEEKLQKIIQIMKLSMFLHTYIKKGNL